MSGITSSIAHVPFSEPKWFALRVRPRYEKLLSSLLKGKGYEEFLPLYRSRRRWSDRFKEVDLPLFPGYLFCRFALRDRCPILSAPGVLHIVGFGGQAVPVSEAEMDAVQRVVKSGKPVVPWTYPQVGQGVVIEYGPLKGVEGILLSVKSVDRLIVSVSLLQRSVAVEVDSHWVRPSRQSADCQARRAITAARMVNN